MQQNKKFIDIDPKEKDIEEIIGWLKKEYDESDFEYGFYNNRNMIYDSYQEGNVIVLKLGLANIGLTLWNEDNIIINLDIFVIKPDYRKKGYGSFFFHTISDYYRMKGFKVIKLFCEPQSSEKFWRNMGLEKWEDCGLTEQKLTYFLRIVETSSVHYIEGADLIELWDVDSDMANGKEPKWRWYIEMRKAKLTFPIIQPCNCNWKIRWSRNGRIIRENKVKYFTNNINELFISSMLYIEELI